MREQPRLLFNSDGDSCTYSFFEPPMTPKQLCRGVDELEDTDVDVFIYNLNRGGDTFSHRTAVGEIYGDSVTTWDVLDRWQSHPRAAYFKECVARRKNVADNTRAILDAGLDPVDILAARSHELGMAFWASLRMNDIHEDDSRRTFAHRSRFKKDHPELLIGSPYPDPERGYPFDNFTWAFDYARQEVRDHELAIILEACQKYDLDGFELDFQRAEWCFKPGEEAPGMPLMTDFVRAVRRGIRAIERSRGRTITVGIRVPPTFDLARRKGFDPETWIREELADLFIPMPAGYLDMGVDIRPYIDAARDTSCRIAAGHEPMAAGYGTASLPVRRAAAMAGYWQGADSIYLFNYDCHRLSGGNGAGPYRADEMQGFREIGDAETIARKDKRYLVARDIKGRLRGAGGSTQLPAALDETCTEASFHFLIGDDLGAAKRDGVLEGVRLRLTVNDHDAPEHWLSVTVNGQPLRRKYRYCLKSNRITYSNVPVRQGHNELMVSLGGAKGRIDGIEIMIDYR